MGVLTSQVFTRDQTFTSPYLSIFPLFFLPKSAKLLPFPCFGSSLKHPIVSPVCDPELLFCCAVQCIPWAAALLVWKVISRAALLTRGAGFHIWSNRLRLCWDSPGRGRGRVFLGSPRFGFLPALVYACALLG